MALKVGNNAVANAFVGSSQVRRAYKGGTLVFQAFGPASEQEFIQQTATGGPAQLLKVYGKSIVNNQLVQNGDFSNGLTDWVEYRGTAAISSGVVSVTSDGTGNLFLYQNAVFPSNNTHSFLLCANVNPSSNARIGFSYWSLDFPDSYQSVPQNQWVRIYYIANPDTQNNPNRRRFCIVMRNATDGAPSAGDILRLKGDISCVDLTLRFGAGNEPTSVDEALRLLGGDAFDPTYDPGSLQSNKTAELRAYDGGTLRGSLALNLATLTSGGVVVYPDGMRGVGDIRDEAEGSTAVQRIGSRAYQSGDESDPDVITDGTSTFYPLATPQTYTLDTPLPTDLTCEQGDILQRVSDNNCPFMGEMKFGL